MRRAVRWVVAVLAVGLALALGVVGWQLYLRQERQRLLEREAARAPVPRPTGAADVPLPPRASACVSGLVLRDGAPVSGATVRVSPPDWRVGDASCPCALEKLACGCGEGLATILGASSAWPGLVPVARVARSDEAGVFSVCGLDGTTARRVWAETDDGAAASPAVEARPGEVHRLELVPLAPLVGVVETSGRLPIAGASVTALTRAGTVPRHATTDAGGRFSVLAGAEVVRLVVGAPGYASRDLELRAAEQPHRVTLTAPARLELKALWNGAPVAGALVVLDRSRRATTDAAGWARFDGLAPEAALRVSARKDRLVGAATVAVAEGATTRAAVTLVPGFVVTGSVVDEQGRPREGSVVSARDESVPVGPAGAFELPPLAPGAITLEADAPGCPGRATQAIDLGADVDVALRLTCEATLAGVVVDAAGAPVADVTVSASCGTDSTSATTGADGTFALAPPPGVCRIETERTGYKALVTTAQAPSTTLRLVIDAGASVSGRVVDANGQPVAGATVLALPVLLEDLIQDENRLKPTTTDAQGRFTLGGLLPGRLGLYASVRGKGRRREQVNLEPGEQRTGVELTLTPTELLEGRVVDEEARPIAGAEVWAVAPSADVMKAALPDMLSGDFSFIADLEAMRARSGVDGRFSLPSGMLPGEPRLHASADGFDGYDAALPTRGPLEIRLVRRREAHVTGRVVDGQGAAIAAFSVNRKAVFAEDGRFKIPRAGVLQVRAAGFATAQVSVPSKPSDGDVDLGDVALAPALALIVTVHDARGAPVDGAYVSARQQGDSSGCSTAQGRCRLGELSAQKVGVTVRKEGFVTATKVHELTGPETALDVTLEAAQGSLDGHALGADGNPTPGLQVRYGYQHRAISGAGGRFRFEGLAHADEALSVTDASGSGMAVRVKVEQSPVSVDVGPAPGGAVIDGRVSGSGPINTASGFVIAVLGAAPAYRGEELLEPSGTMLFMDDVARVAWTPVRQGRFTLAGLPPGRWALYLGGLSSAAEEAVKPRATIDLTAGERRTVELSP